ncbi:hypothetical protein NDU88_003051 [Pleurodeles waltl]|uniref:Uncharacterized protein n=1 Tax=Pleurodeles waltl TaxID=8319 RepID=A0AAV7LE79_PLEWA|nr:hypothetical protein NDU88_003051 [Pleurodeles waltl]
MCLCGRPGKGIGFTPERDTRWVLPGGDPRRSLRAAVPPERDLRGPGLRVCGLLVSGRAVTRPGRPGLICPGGGAVRCAGLVEVGGGPLFRQSYWGAEAPSSVTGGWIPRLGRACSGPSGARPCWRA